MSIKYPNIWKLNKIILNHQWVKENHAMEVRKYAKLNGNKIVYLWNTAKAMHSDEFILCLYPKGRNA